jgi:hypothetical protein
MDVVLIECERADDHPDSETFVFLLPLLREGKREGRERERVKESEREREGGSKTYK